jgi:CO/xanthine dehydrogenase FAD-binding subunit
MKPASFELLRPTTRAEALALLAEEPDDTIVLAGGQSLVPLLNMRFVVADRILDLNAVSELAYAEDRGSELALGAMTRHREVETSPLVIESAGLLSRAVRHVGYASIRNRGTVGGTIAHADTVAQVPCAAVALDAIVVLESSARGKREVSTSEFFAGNLMNTREPDELVVEVRVPNRPAGALFGFAEFARKSGDFPLVTAAVQIDQADGLSRNARIAVGGAAPMPVRLADCEAALEGERLDGQRAAAVAQLAAASVTPPDSPFVSQDYRRNLVRVIVHRALLHAIDSRQEIR